MSFQSNNPTAENSTSVFPSNSNGHGVFYIGSPHVLPVSIPIDNHTVTIPYEMLKRREENLTNFIKKTQENNIIVARFNFRNLFFFLI